MSQRNLNNDSAISVASLHTARKTEAGEQGARPEPVSGLYQPGSSSAAPDHASNEYLTSQQPAVPAPPLDSNQPQPSSHTGTEEELGSHVTSPLTHPNGVAIFPSLSTAEQDQLSRDALQQAQHVIIADIEPPNDDTESQSDGDHTDGGYESLSEESSSTSLASSVRGFLFENGRRYHSFREGTYNFPNDEVEQEREDMKHAMMKLLCSQKLHFAPIGENPQRILDIGTGTGIWAIEIGDQFPSAEVLGVDLSPIQPNWIPPNVRFVVDDVESPWLYPRDHFDYIHSRHTVMAIKNWPRLLRRSLEHLKPGGWMEMQEIHHSPLSGHSTGVVPPDNPVAQYWSLINAGLSALGVDFHAAAGSKLSNMMREAGFINVTERVLHVPLGTWPRNKVLKAVGLYWRTILVDGLQAIALGPLTRGLRWDRNRIEMLLMNVRRAYMDDSALIYMRLHLVYGQKA